jgi:hypothetical protein
MSNPVMEDRSMNIKKHPELGKSAIIKHLPKACGDEKAAVEFFERQRWGTPPATVWQPSGLQNYSVFAPLKK